MTNDTKHVDDVSTGSAQDPAGSAINRRRLLRGGAGALAIGLIGSASVSIASAAEQQARLRLTVPAPTGPHQVATVSLHLVDHTRQDPWWTATHPRELMVSLWYPARDAGRQARAPWMPPAALAYYRTASASQLEQAARMLGLGEVTISLDTVDYPLTHAREGVPVQLADRPYPVVLYSPGLGLDRELGTTLVEDLASHGYIVVTIDHTYDAGEVEFPGNRVELGRPNLDQDGHSQVAVRYADTRFVLDQLAALAAGRNPDAGRRPLPAGLPGCLASARIGMFGHSLGGATTAQSMAHDARIVAGIDLDGSVIPDVPFGPPTPREQAAELAGQVADKIGNRPFMIMTSGGSGPDQLGALMTGFWSHLKGWRRFLSLNGSTHGSYTDEMQLIRQLAAAGVIPSGLASTVGTIDPNRATAIQRAYIGAFFDRWLRHHDDAGLLDGPSARYPEVVFFPSA